MAADGSHPINLTNHPALDGFAVWSPDGTRIAFTSNRDGNTEIYVMNADGKSPDQPDEPLRLRGCAGVVARWEHDRLCHEPQR